jgi:hypothetical protein
LPRWPTNDPEHDNLKQWIGGWFDPAAFDIAEVNHHLTSDEY